MFDATHMTWVQRPYPEYSLLPFDEMQEIALMNIFKTRSVSVAYL